MSEETEVGLWDTAFYKSAFGTAAIHGDADAMRRIAEATSVRATDYPRAIEVLTWARLNDSPERQQEALRALAVLEELGFRVTDDRFRGREPLFGWPTIIGELVWRRVDNADIARALIRLGASPSRMYADTPVDYETWQAAYELGLDALASALQEASRGNTPTPGNTLVRACLQSNPVAARDALEEIPRTERSRAVRAAGASGERALNAALRSAFYSLRTRHDDASYDEMRDQALAVLLLVIDEAGPIAAHEGAAMAAVAATGGDISLWLDVRTRMGAEELAVLRRESLHNVFSEEFHTLPYFPNTPDPVAARLVLFDAFGRDSEAMRLSGEMMGMHVAQREGPDGQSDLERFESSLRDAAAGEGVHFDVTVRVASTRRPKLDAPASRRFGEADPEGRLSFGTAAVRVPLLGRGYGEFPEVGFLARVMGHMPPGLVAIMSCEVEDGVEVSTQRGAAEALIFVHGYNVSFEQAVRRAAQIAVDVKTTADPWAFCWPSKGSLFAYGADAEQVPDAGNALAALVDKLSALYQRIHVYAHSTGARIVHVAAQQLTASGRRLAELVLFAGDLDVQVFRTNVRKIGGVCERLTSYSSRRDKLLRLSRVVRFAKETRVGDGVPDLTGVNPPVANVELVDATSVDSSGFFGFLNLGHFYYGGARTVLLDLHELLAGARAANRPATVYEPAPPHWRLR